MAQGFAEYGVAPWGLQMGARFALFGLAGHAMFTGIFGAFLGGARQTGRRWLRVLLPLIGLLLAILAHALNNSLGLLITILLRSAGEPLPEPGPPPQIAVRAGLAADQPAEPDRLPALRPAVARSCCGAADARSAG